jgi:hypothetical protein
MKYQRLFGTAAVMAGVLSMTAAAGWAQDGSRTSNGNTTGSAVPRGGDGGGAASSGGASSTSSGGSSGGSSSGSVSSGGGSTTPGAWSSFEAPTRASDQGSRSRTASGSNTGGRATPRGDSGSGASSSPRSGGNATASSSGGSSSDQAAPSRRAVPAYSRPRGGQPVTGEVADRGSVAPPPIIVNPIYPYYPWGFYGGGYGYGLGYLYYDPFGFGYGFGAPYGYYGGGYGGGGGGGYAVSSSSHDTGAIRLKVNPKQAKISIDGYYVGVVDSFDGNFQKLELDAGSHRVQLTADGYEPLEFEVVVERGETATYKGEMKRVQ